MAVIIGQIVLRDNKNVITELNVKIPGIGYTIAKKINILNGCLASIKVKELTGRQSQALYQVVKKYKGLYDYKYYVHKKIFAALRRADNAYRYLRYLKGYPINQRTRSNGKTASRRIKGSKDTGFKSGSKGKSSKKKKGKATFKITAKNRQVMTQLKKLQAKKEKAAKQILWKEKSKTK